MTLPCIDKKKTTERASLREKDKEFNVGNIILRYLRGGQREMLSSQVDMHSGVRKDGIRDKCLEAVNV